MIQSIGLVAIATLLFLSVPARASETSERLTARGLAAFHKEHYQDALLLFDQAVDADATDAHALYYRGACRARLNQVDGAIADLRAALDLDPNLAPAAVELGVALIQQGAYAEAVGPLERAQQDPVTAARASLFLGVAYLRLDQHERAREALDRAAQDPTLEASAQYYLGVLAYQEQHWDEAESRFAAVVDLSPGSSIGQESAAFLERLQQTHARRYRLYGSVGLQYDSNVVLAPATNIPTLGISQQADGSVVLNAAIDAVPYESERATIVIGYNFFQSLHFELTNFNLDQNLVNAQISGNWEWLQYGFLGRYSYYFLETSSFLQEATALPWLTANEATFGRTEFYYRTRYRDFFLLPYPQLNALNYAVGLRQVFYLGRPDRFASIGYQFDNQDPTKSARSFSPSGSMFGYNGQEVNVGFGWLLPWTTTFEAGYAFRYEDYAGASMGRIDTPNQWVVGLTKDLTQWLAVNLAYLGTIHTSNQPQYDYNRNIVSLILEATY
jgi:tetratricopeptide (TPR) repeat protein